MFELSLPEVFSDGAPMSQGVDKTPQSSRIVGGKPRMIVPSDKTIDLESPPEHMVEDPVPDPIEGERNWNLTDVFIQLDEPNASPTIGSKIGVAEQLEMGTE